MAITEDPENYETRVLSDLVDFAGKRVLEIGCGTGRLTWRYADKAAHVIGIDPIAEDIATAKENRPDRLRDRVEFIGSHHRGLRTACGRAEVRCSPVRVVSLMNRP